MNFFKSTVFKVKNISEYKREAVFALKGMQPYQSSPNQNVLYVSSVMITLSFIVTVFIVIKKKKKIELPCRPR